MKKEYSQKKIDGATFTSDGLASFLASRLFEYINNKEERLAISDPACGDGALLLALARVLAGNNMNFVVFGSDKNDSSVNATTELLNNAFPSIPVSIETKNFIENPVSNIFVNQAEQIDITIANPPYVRTQILGSEYAQKIAKLYNLSGRVDLYYPFLINMTENIKENGLLGVITSNRYLSTKSGAAIRKYLMQHYEILEIIDLGDTKLFDAAVLPAIFIGRKRTNSKYNPNTKYIKIYECSANEDAELANDVFEVLNQGKDGTYRIADKYYNLTVGKLKETSEPSDIWQLETVQNNDFISTIEKNSNKTVSDIFKVRVGVKSCADEVFFLQNFIDSKPEPVWFRPMISQENISKWVINNDLLQVIYPHYNNKGKKAVLDLSKYPEATKFFTEHEERLKSRKYLIKAKRNWYEYWVPQNATLWEKPKLVWADISVEPRFAIDKTGAIVNGNCYWICAETKEQEEMLYLIMAVANSKLMEMYHDIRFNNKLYSGRRRYLSQYVEQYPIPDAKTKTGQDIIRKVKKLISTDQLSKREKIIEEIEKLVRLSFGFKD